MALQFPSQFPFSGQLSGLTGSYLPTSTGVNGQASNLAGLYRPTEGYYGLQASPSFSSLNPFFSQGTSIGMPSALYTGQGMQGNYLGQVPIGVPFQSNALSQYYQTGLTSATNPYSNQGGDPQGIIASSQGLTKLFGSIPDIYNMPDTNLSTDEVMNFLMSSSEMSVKTVIKDLARLVDSQELSNMAFGYQSAGKSSVLGYNSATDSNAFAAYSASITQNVGNKLYVPMNNMVLSLVKQLQQILNSSLVSAGGPLQHLGRFDPDLLQELSVLENKMKTITQQKEQDLQWGTSQQQLVRNMSAPAGGGQKQA